MDPPGAPRPTTQAPSMGATTYARANDVLDMLDSKGPTTESERIYRKVKTLYKQLLGLCTELDQRPDVPAHKLIVIREKPETFGQPPGGKWPWLSDRVKPHPEFQEIERQIMGVATGIIRADRSTNQKMADAHQKLRILMQKVKTLVEAQNRQIRLDAEIRNVQGKFSTVIYSLQLKPQTEPPLTGWETLDMPAVFRKFSSYNATPAAMEMLEKTEGGAVLLVPSDSGWAGAIQSAKRAMWLSSDFPDMSQPPLNRIAALELSAYEVTKGKGFAKKTVMEGRLRILSTPELTYKILHHATGEAHELVTGHLQIIPVESSGWRPILPSRWVDRDMCRHVLGQSEERDGRDGQDDGFRLTASNQLLIYAELTTVDLTRLPFLLNCLEGARWSTQRFLTAVQEFCQTRERYRHVSLNRHLDYEDLMVYPRAFFQVLADNVTDQIQHQGQVSDDIETVLGQLKDLVNRSRDEVVESEDSENEDEDSYYEDDPHQYFDLDADAMSNPPYNPDYRARKADSPTRFERPSATVRTPQPPPSVPARGTPPQRERANHDMPRFRRDRSSSNESARSGGVGERVSPPATTASQVRGDDKTHTLALQLQRSRTVMMSLEAKPDSTRYKAQREKVGRILALAEKHLREDSDVSVSYEGFLAEEMERTEEACGVKDDEFDAAEKRKKKAEDDKKDLLATLPRGLGQKFSGNPADWPNFREHFERIMKNVEPTLAVAAMTGLIDCPKLRKRMKIYSSGEQVLRDFDKDFGHSFLNCQTIINKINNLPNATDEKQEMDLITQYRHAKRSLDKNSDHEKLLTSSLLLFWADKLLESTTRDLIKLIQQTNFGEDSSPVEQFFAHIEKVYESNSVLIRNREARQPHRSGKEGQVPGGRNRKGKQEVYETDSRRYGNEEEKGGCGALCSTGPQHKTFNCPLIKSGKAGLKKIRQAKLCTCCLRNSADCLQGQIKKKDGTMISLACAKCKHSKRIPIHQNCKDKSGQSNQSGQVEPVAGPPVPVPSGAPVAASLTELRTEIAVLANPNPLGTASELVDYCMLEAPDGRRFTVRCLYDAGGTDTILDWRLSKLFHHYVPVTVGVNGAVGSRNFSSHVGELKVVRADGQTFNLKSIKGDLSGRAFTLKQKFVDVPPCLHRFFEGSYQHYNDVGDIRYFNAHSDFQIQLVIGLDALAFTPVEMGRGHDEYGQLAVYKSFISGAVLVAGSRRSGNAASNHGESHQRSYVITDENNHEVSLMRTVHTQDSREIFAKRSALTKIERKLFSHIEDQDELVPPQPELCPNCKDCQICTDPFKARREQTVINLLDQLVTFKEGKHEEGGGYHVKLLFDPELLDKVPEGKEAALRRLLSTERQLLRPGMEKARAHFNEKVQKCRDKGYLLPPDRYKDLSHLQKAYQPYSFALKDEEKLGEDGQTGAPEHKTKARPVVDCSAIALPGGVSVNGAQFKIPDVHTLKISQILLRLRSAKRFCIGDITEYYFRLFCDELTTSLTRVLFREGGLGNKGPIIELVSPVTSMGMKQISTFSAHVRYRISLTIQDVDPIAAKQLRDSYCDDISVFELFGECTQQGDHECSDGEILARRAKLIEQALQRAHLHLGDNWKTDIDQEKCLESMTGVTRSDEEMAITLGNAEQTSALGYRVHLGPDLPSGGALLWRVHRPNSLNIEPKQRGARPDWAQLASSTDIRKYLNEHGVSKASLLSLCSNLFDPLLLTAPFISTSRQLFRLVLREVKLDSWKARVPEVYYDRIAQLAEDLLTVGKKLQVPRRAVVPNPFSEEAHQYPYGFATLLIISDGSCEAGVAAAYVHQQFPFESGTWGPEADFSGVVTTCNLLCAAVKLTDSKGNNTQVCGELLGKFIACQMKDFILKNVLVTFHRVRTCSDSLTVEKAIRKTDACYSIWAGKRIASIQRSIDLDQSWHIPHEITDATVDACTKYQKVPSASLNDQWFYGKGVLDKPLQLLPFTDRSTYSQPRLDDLPSQWLSSAARTFLGMKIPAVVVMKMTIEDMSAPLQSTLEFLAQKYTNVEKAISVVQYLLTMKPGFRQLPMHLQREVSLDKFVSHDYEKISSQLKQKSTKLTQELVLEDNKVDKVFRLKGRFNYRAKLLANPKTSAFSRLVLKDAHNKQHITSSARILAKVTRTYVFTGGALAYLDRLRKGCAMCRQLKPMAVKMFMGNPPDFMRGPLPDARSTWTFQSCDIFGPWTALAFPGARGTRQSTKRVKLWAILVCDYASRAVDAELCESYSADSVLLALQAVWSRTGRPKFLNFDAAQNITSAGTILGGVEGEAPTLAEGEALQNQLQRQLGQHIEMRPKVPYAPHRQSLAERSVAFVKKKLQHLLYHEAGSLLTPLQAASTLSQSVAFINERPLMIYGIRNQLGHLTPWFLSPRSISVYHSQVVSENPLLENPLSRRAVEGQRRLEVFKRDFNIFYHRQMVRFGKWATEEERPSVGSVVLILDKEKGKSHFLQKFKVGRLTRFLSDHTCELEYVRQDPEVTAKLVRSLQSTSPAWKSHYQVTTKTCIRDIKGLSILVDGSQPDQWQDGLDVDLVIGPQGPAQDAPDAQDAPVAQDALDAQDAPTAQDAPDAQDAPVVQDALDAQVAPRAQDAPDAQDAPVAQDALDAQDAPTARDAPVVQDVPAAQDDTFAPATQEAPNTLEEQGSAELMPRRIGRTRRVPEHYQAGFS